MHREIGCSPRLIAALAAGLLVVMGLLFFLPQDRIRNADPVNKLVVCFGDSLTYGTGGGPGGSYPEQLAVLSGLEVLNAGVPGDTTAAALARLDEDVLSQNPGYVLITLGGNDLRRKRPLDEVADELERIIAACQETGALVVVGGIKIPLLGGELSALYREVVRRNGAVLIPDIYEGILGKSEYMSDSVHPNARGYAVMAATFYRALKPYL